MKCNSGDFGAVPRGMPRPMPKPMPYFPVKKKGMGDADFGGISYTSGDFYTPGTSGMGTSANDIFSAIFGDKGAETVKTTLQSGATTALTNVVGSKLGTDPNAQKAVTDTVMASVAEIFSKYKIVIIPVAAGLTILTALGLFNTFKKKV